MLVSNYPNVSINTANPPTEMARRDALRRDLFEPVKETNASGAEKPILTDDKSRSAPTNNGTVQLYNANGKDAETPQAIEGRGEQGSDKQDGEPGQQSQQDSKGNSETKQSARQQQAEQLEQQEIRELSARDQEVKTHEQAHAAVGGQYAGAPSYSYERGPDGKQYAVAGEVQIDIAPVAGDPQATVQKMQQVRAAALAPAEPSAADRRIAGEALQRQMQAQAELVQQTTKTSNTDKTPAQSTANDGAAATAVAGSNENRRFAEQLTQADISYRVAENNGSNTVVYQQRDTLAESMQMQLRRSVIAGYYQKATEPQVKQSLQQI
ncbi:putative metalloprotease CJM1_0395 family protein [Rheinheimera gaetbuli]